MAQKSLLLILVLAISVVVATAARPPPLYKLTDIHPSAPQQVHISLSGKDHMRITWITMTHTPPRVYYDTNPNLTNPFYADGTSYSYIYIAYLSGNIHNAVIGPLKPDTVYYYRCSSMSSRQLSFKTPPSKFPVKFAVVGDLGQSIWSNSTLQHIAASDCDALLLPGDLAYSYMNQLMWDTFGLIVEPLASSRPWMVTQGNHEIETLPLMHKEPFTAYNARWVMPYKESSSPSNLFYSFDMTGVHVLMLGSYADFGPNSNQYRWLKEDLKKVDRKKTPWLIALMHAPWYNSNRMHQDESECIDMKSSMEEVLYNAGVSFAFSGHVHAYERFVKIYKEKEDECGPVYITVGDGGNQEGLSLIFINPQPKISAFREASFGHGQLLIVNATHALWTWHKNDNDVSIASDLIWLTNSADCKKS